MKFGLTYLFLHKNPAFKAVLFLFVPIIILSKIELDYQDSLLLASTTFVLYISTLILKKYFFRYLISLLLISSLINLYISSKRIKFSEEFNSELIGFFNGEIKELTSTKGKLRSYVANGAIDLKRLEAFSGNINLKIYGDEIYETGDIISGELRFTAPNPKQIFTDFPDRYYLLSKDICFRAFAFDDKVYKSGESNSIFDFINGIQKNLEKKLKALFEVKNFGVFQAMLTGKRVNVDSESREIFSLTGTAHLMAVSGFHIGIIGLLIWYFIRRMRLKLLKVVLFCFFIFSFVVFTGASPSAVRAGIMGVLIVVCLVYQWNYSLLNIFGVAVLFSVLINPLVIYSLSFHLSVSAVFGIVSLYGLITNQIYRKFNFRNKLIKALINSIIVSSLASIFVAPVSAYYFGTFPVYAIPANLLSIPMIALSMVFAIFSLVFSFISDYLAYGFSFIAEVILIIVKIWDKFLLSIDYSVVYGKNAFLLSVLILPVFVYLSISKNLKVFALRSFVSAVVVLLFLNIEFSKNLNIQRKNYHVFDLSTEHESIYLISEYEHNSTNFPDFAFEKYLKQKEIVKIIAYEPSYFLSENILNSSSLKFQRVRNNFNPNQIGKILKEINNGKN